MNPLGSLSHRDGFALALAAGVKIGGGSWSQAFAWGIGARLAMNYLGFPDEAMGPQAQNVMSMAGSFCQRIFGQPPAQVVEQYGSAGGDVIDAEYVSYGSHP